MGEKRKFPPSIGIDLGTTFSCAAVLQRGQVDIIPNDLGGRTTPSCVAFSAEERLIGLAAETQLTKNPKNTVFDVKRLIGRPYNNPSVHADRKRWAFQVVDRRGKPKILVSHQDQDREFLPEEISAMVLEHMKKIATDYIGEEISSAVVTVPAYFNDAQRRATKDAAAIAGIHVLAMLNEPTAAALAYGLEKKAESARNIVIYDLGGGTFDVTVLTINGGLFTVKSTAGNTHLGGQDFNDRLFNHFAALFCRTHGVDITKNDRSKYKLRKECECAKRMLTSGRKTSVYIDALYDGIDFQATVTRAFFEQLNSDLFEGTMETVEMALEEAGMSKEMINDVVLVGGSTNIPFIRSMLEDYFGRQKICRNVNPDEAVAYGAALHAAFLSGDTSAEMKNFELQDVTPLSLGIEVKGDEMSFLIMKNTKIPTEKWRQFKTSSKNQTNVEIRVLEGERTMTRLNNFLGSFHLNDIPPMPAGEAKIDVCFKIDSNGVLDVSAVEKSSGKETKITIKQDDGRLRQEEINKMTDDAKQFRKQDEEWKEKKDALNDLESIANEAKFFAETKRERSNVLMKKNEYIAAECEELLEWIEENRSAPVEAFKERKDALHEKLATLYPEKKW